MQKKGAQIGQAMRLLYNLIKRCFINSKIKSCFMLSGDLPFPLYLYHSFVFSFFLLFSFLYVMNTSTLLPLHAPILSYSLSFYLSFSAFPFLSSVPDSRMIIAFYFHFLYKTPKSSIPPLLCSRLSCSLWKLRSWLSNPKLAKTKTFLSFFLFKFQSLSSN